MDVVTAWQGLGEHIAGRDVDPVLEAALGDHLAGDTVDRRPFEDRGAQFGVIGDERAGVDARAARDIEQTRTRADGGSLGHRRAEGEAARIHRRGEAGRERLGEHRFAPGLLVLVTAPVGGLIGLQDDDEVLHHRTVLQGGVIGAQEDRRGADEVLLSECRHGKDAVLQRQEAVRGEERQHHVGRPAVRAEVTADRGEVGWLGRELREQVELGDRGGDQVDRIESVAEAVDAERVGRGRTGEVERGGHGQGLYDDSPCGENHPFYRAYLAFFLPAFFLDPSPASPGLSANSGILKSMALACLAYSASSRVRSAE